MASDFTYEGEANRQFVFREKKAGMIFHLFNSVPGSTPELLDGDEVAVPNPNDPYESWIYSLRGQTVVRREPRRS